MYHSHLVLWKVSERYGSFLVDEGVEVLRSFQQESAHEQDLFTYIHKQFFKFGLQEMGTILQTNWYVFWHACMSLWTALLLRLLSATSVVTVLMFSQSQKLKWLYYVCRGRLVAALFIGLVTVFLLSCLWLSQSTDVAVFPFLLVRTLIVMVAVIVLTTAQTWGTSSGHKCNYQFVLTLKFESLKWPNF